MRILVITRSVPAHRHSGGMERVAWDLMQGWHEMGDQVTCLTTPIDSRGVQPDFDLVTLPGRPGRYSKSWFQQTADYVEEHEFDVILGVSAGAHSVIERNASRTPVVMQAHGTAIDEILTRLSIGGWKGWARALMMVPGLIRDLRNYRRYNCLVAIGSSVTTTLNRYPKRWQPRRLLVIENGVDNLAETQQVQIDAPFPRPTGRPTACFIGRVNTEKGVDLVVEALMSWRGDLKIVGDGPSLPELKKFVADKGLDSRVTFCGRLDGAELRLALRESDVVVAPSRRREGLPLVALESLAAGKPFVCSENIAQSFGPDLPIGVFVTETNANAIAMTLDQVLKTPGDAIFLPKKFEMSTCTRRYRGLFKTLISEEDRNA